jgi:hypothetical protein
MQICKGIFDCDINLCSKCEAFIQEEGARTAARMLRKPPPPTPRERLAKKAVKKRNKSIKAAVSEAKEDLKSGKIKKMSHFFKSKK